MCLHNLWSLGPTAGILRALTSVKRNSDVEKLSRHLICWFGVLICLVGFGFFFFFLLTTVIL